MAPPRAYSIFDKVEVIGYEQGFLGSYYEATVVSVLGDGRYQVLYKNLIEDEETKIPIKEKLFPRVLRSRPPRVRTVEFKVGQNVDVFINEGWWIGKIVAVDIERSLYMVYFRSTNKITEYHSSSIRVHQDLIDGLWYQSGP